MYVSKLSYLARTCQCLQRQHKYNVYVTITLYCILFFLSVYKRNPSPSVTILRVDTGYKVKIYENDLKIKYIKVYTTIKHSGEQTKRQTI